MRRDDLFGKSIALLLDFDGTLVDLAPDPMQVIVPPELIEAIDKIITTTHTPIAIVTGRQIRVLDEFLGLPNLAVSGNHGTEIRLPGSELVTHHAPPMPETFRLALVSFCAEFSCILEDKHEIAVIRTSNEVTFHAIRDELQRILSEQFQNYTLWPVGFSLEIHYRGVSKVTGIQDMLSTRAFKECVPVYIGDDVETYPGFEFLAKDVRMIAVGKNNGDGFTSPYHVRKFLSDFVDHREGGNYSLAALLAEFGFLHRRV